MKANPGKMTVVALAALVWTLFVAFILCGLERFGPVNAVIAAIAAVWNILSLWFIRLEDTSTRTAHSLM
jgi:hypothetical protein